MYDRDNLRASQLNAVFPGCLPCRCYERQDRTYMVPRYSIKFKHKIKDYAEHKRIIYEIIVECHCCARVARYNVEKLSICKEDICW